MGIDIQQEQKGPREAAPAKAETTPAVEVRQPLLQRISDGIRQVRWPLVLISAAVMALLWCVLFLVANSTRDRSWLQIFAGVIPVFAGLIVGRRVKGNYLANGIFLGLASFAFGFLIMAGYGALSDAGVVPQARIQMVPDSDPTPVAMADLITYYILYSFVALIPFPAFGTVMSGRTEQRNREMRQQVEERGGSLQRPGVIRTLEDLQGLSLPQLGRYVVDLFRKKGFEFKDYRFIDKDRHLDIELAYKEEVYLLRLSVADKVRSGTVESLTQDMKRRDIAKGIVITSTEFASDVTKAVGQRKNLLAIDGKTLYEIAEK
jgi:hypothetical protein